MSLIVCYVRAFPKVDYLTIGLRARGFYRLMIGEGQSRWKPSVSNLILFLRNPVADVFGTEYR